MAFGASPFGEVPFGEEATSAERAHLRLYRHAGSGAPDTLLFGEPAFSDGEPRLWIGNSDGTMSEFVDKTYVDAANGGNVKTLANTSGGSIAAGSAVMMNLGSTGILPWDGTREIVGIARVSIADSTSGQVQTEGPLTLADWTDATGSATLGTGTWYGDPSTPGSITQTAPTAVGEMVQRVGVTVAGDTLEIRVGQPIKL